MISVVPLPARNTPDVNILLPTCGYSTNNHFHRVVKAKQRRIKYKQLSKTIKKQNSKHKVIQQRRTINNRLNPWNKNRQQHIQSRNRQRLHKSPIKRKRVHTVTRPSRQQYKSKTNKTKSSKKRMKTRSNASTRTIHQQRLRSLTKSVSSPQAKQHVFEKHDRKTSLMALQALAEKIALYKEKYGDIETRHSSIITPPKLSKRRKRFKKK